MSILSKYSSLQVVEQELKSREASLENIRLLALKLVQGVGGAHLNADAIHSKMNNVSRRWNHLKSLATERYCMDSSCARVGDSK